MMNIYPFITGIALAGLLTACGGGGSSSTSSNENTGADDRSTSIEPVEETEALSASELSSDAFVDHCADQGFAKAQQINSANFQLDGPNAIASAGDYLLANDKAMFAITGVGLQKTYYHYPGILVDAVALDGCNQISDDHFFELPLMVGKLNVANQSQSTFRAFNAHTIEVINDGADGNAAIVRATGSDDIYWLLELTLMGRAILADTPKYLSSPFDLEVVVDYILEPDSPTLKIDYKLVNTRDWLNSFNIAFVLMSSGEGSTLNTFSAFDADIEGLELQHRIPWVSTNEDENAYIYSAETDALTTTHIAGVDALLDAKQLANTFLGTLLAPAGEDGDSFEQHFYVTVSDGDELTAIQQHVEHATVETDLVQTPVSITVTEQTTGTPVPNAKIIFETKKQRLLDSWPWETFLTAYTDENGQLSTDIPLVKYLSDQPYRIIASATGRTSSTPEILLRADQTDLSSQSFDLSLSPQGRVNFSIVDNGGTSSPAKLSFYQNGHRIKQVFSVSGNGELFLPPGNYDVGISRGFEYGVVETNIDVPSTGTAQLNAELIHWIDTTGYLSYDAHIHSAPSPDSEVSKEDRIRTAVAAGLEVVVSTDHEIITDLSPSVVNVGAENLVVTVIGQEVTASIPNHTIAFPLNRDTTKLRDFVPWHGHDIDEVFAIEKAAGAEIRTFAHPRGEYLELIEWDRITGAPGHVDPGTLGLPDDAILWSWNFEAMEYMNGKQKVFSSGIFEDWMSFLNHGHHIIATGASDVHGIDTPGTPRTYFAAASDKIADFNQDEMVASIKSGNVVVSLGGFANASLNGSAKLGDTLTDQDGSVDLTVTLQAIPQVDIDHARVYVNCDEVARIPASNPLDSAVKIDTILSIPVPTDSDSHLVVLGFGAEFMPREFEQFDPTEVPRVTTNPIFIDADGNGIYDAPGGKECAI